MLYKTRGFYGESAVADVACPITGHWRFTYTNRGDSMASCASPSSRATDCPTRRNLDLMFQGCSFPNWEMNYKCLGSWKVRILLLILILFLLFHLLTSCCRVETVKTTWPSWILNCLSWERRSDQDIAVG